MTDRTIPFGITLKYSIAVCAFVWLLTFLFPVYVGIVALFFGLICAAVCAFRWLSRLRKEARQRVRLKAVRQAIDEARARKAAVSKGLKQPNQSATIRHINERISALMFEQLRLESALRRDVEAK